MNDGRFNLALESSHLLLEEDPHNAPELIQGLFSSLVWNLPEGELQTLQTQVQHGRSVLEAAHQAIINERLERHRRDI